MWTQGTLAEAWGLRPTPEDPHVLLCGNPQMVESMVEIVKKEGFTEPRPRSPGQCHLERYW